MTTEMLGNGPIIGIKNIILSPIKISTVDASSSLRYPCDNNFEVNEVGYCSFCAEISPWAEISAKTLVIL